MSTKNQRREGISFTNVISGLNNAGVDRKFYSGTNIKSTFICSLGYGDPASLHPRNPRLSLKAAGRFA
jgi:3-hydroxypropanoate dehydrogenase